MCKSLDATIGCVDTVNPGLMSRSYHLGTLDLPPLPDTRGSGAGSSAPYADSSPWPAVGVDEQRDDACAVFWLDLAGRITRWAASCSATFGFPSGAGPTRFEELFLVEDRRHGIPALILRHARDLGSWEGTGWRVREGDDPFWAASSVSLVRTPNGLEIGFMIVTRDLSQLRGYDHSSPEDDRARLVSLGRVASEVSHDVRNILAAIRGFASALERLDPSNSASGVVREELLKACDRGTLLTQRLLGVGAGGEASSEPTDLGALVRGAEPLLRQVLPSRIELKIRVEPGLPTVRARSDDAELALLNLVLNARDAIPAAGLIEVSVTGDASGGGVLTVRDSGVGMSGEVLARCRERAFTTKGSADGSGLGLVIVQEAAREFGGSFRIESEPGVGTSAQLGFRGVGAAADEKGASSTVASGPSAVVLLWGSSSLATELLTGILKRNGWPVAVVDSSDGGAEALDRFGHRTAVLVADGIEAGRACAPLLDSSGRTTKSILLVAEPAENEVAGLFDQQLVGPIDPDALLACVAEVCREDERLLRSIH